MSHFSVAVFTDENTTVEDLLETFDENLEVEEYVAMKRYINMKLDFMKMKRL